MTANTRATFSLAGARCPSRLSEPATPEVRGSIYYFDDVSVTDVRQGPTRIAPTPSSPGAGCVSVYFLRTGSFVVRHQGRRLCFGEGSAAFSSNRSSAVAESIGQTRAAVINVPLSRLPQSPTSRDFASFGLATVHASPLFDFVETLIDTVAVNAIPSEPTATILVNLIVDLLHSEDEPLLATTQPGSPVSPRRTAATEDRRPLMAMLALQSPAENAQPLEYIAQRVGFSTVTELQRSLKATFGVKAQNIRSTQIPQTGRKLVKERGQEVQQDSAATAPKFQYTSHVAGMPASPLTR